MALEADKPGKSKSDLPNGKKLESMADVGKEGSVDLQKQLNDLRDRLRARRGEMKVLALAQARKEVGEKDEVVKGEPTADKSENRRKERLFNYGELLNEKKEGKTDVAKFAFEEIRDYNFNKESFNGKTGWLAEFQASDNEKVSFEEFVLQKQYEELYGIRETLLEARVKSSLVKIYPKLDGEENKKDKDAKEEEVSKSAKVFFKEKSDEIEKFLAAKPVERIDLRKQLYADFKSTVFADAEKDENTNDLINTLFNQLIDDYQEMKNAMAATKKLNPKMVQMLLNNVSEEEWEEELAKEAELQAKKLKEKQKVEAEVTEVSKQSYVGDVDFRVSYYGGGLSADEKLGGGTDLRFEKVGNGQYKVVFPSDEVNGKEESFFMVREIKNEKNERSLVFGFADPLMDKPAFIGERKLKGQINGLYLEHIMHDSVKRDKDYLGPDLNDIIHDDEMFKLASMLFAPKKLEEMAIDKEEAENFKKLMQLLVNPANNKPGKGIYGDMMAIRNRVSLIKTVLASASDMPGKCFLQLTKLSAVELKVFSLEKFFDEKLAVPRNDGNFAKT